MRSSRYSDLERPEPDWLSSTELVEEVPGLSYRVLDYWCRTGSIPFYASGSGQRRWHPPEAVASVRRAIRAKAHMDARTRTAVGATPNLSFAQLMVVADLLDKVAGVKALDDSGWRPSYTVDGGGVFS